MKFNFFSTVALSLLSISVHAQLPEYVGGLISADRNAAALSRTHTPHVGLTSIIDNMSTFYVPSAVNAKNYLNNRPNIPDVLSWEPNFALVSKSLDWGVTSGKMSFQKMGAVKRNGQYLIIWKRGKKGEWRIDKRAEVENFGKQEPKELVYTEPDGTWYLKHRSKVRLKQREDIVLSTDELFSKVSKANTESAYKEFLAEDVRFYYPWEEEIEGKANVISFIKKKRIDIVTEPETVGRSYSGEFAYSQGSATVHTKEKAIKFNYIRIWELDKDFQWRIKLEMLFEK